MVFLMVLSLLLAQAPQPVPQPVPSSDFVVGQAAYYDPSYDSGGWRRIVASRRSWGQLPDDFADSSDGYYCAHPDLPFGAHVRVMNAITGESVTCVVVDRVAPQDQARWRASVVIELSYKAFVDAGGRAFNRFVVWQADDGGVSDG